MRQSAEPGQQVIAFSGLGCSEGFRIQGKGNHCNQIEFEDNWKKKAINESGLQKPEFCVRVQRNPTRQLTQLKLNLPHHLKGLNLVASLKEFGIHSKAKSLNPHVNSKGRLPAHSFLNFKNTILHNPTRPVYSQQAFNYGTIRLHRCLT